ncbi:apoptosis-associated speck-like protein containing a CARD [Latimeria chalumnae]|uniref:Pyrin domain-containing protein n=1 Tax=Latimeria chalumnae TaxID=7897 RepID=H3AK96_LATCH|nr:PREDICTED: apoptosis-associated speck-like protein containing a CARD [Latimeria chalumnae]|eukprot:XP_006002253.1 PREDICTED: apoptosis-associated speck-like protein containing a CARD [Latimeria chalumnae]
MGTKDELINTLDELGESGLKRFKSKLSDLQLRQGYSKIPKGKLEKADILDLVDLLIGYYKQDYALVVTLDVLNQINQKDLASELAEKTQTAWPPAQGAPSSGGASSAAAASFSGAEFVDQYRIELIQRVTMVCPILDHLLSKRVINDGTYDKIRNISTSQEQMRELYTTSRAWGTAGKEEFYKAIERENPYLVDDLRKN